MFLFYTFLSVLHSNLILYTIGDIKLDIPMFAWNLTANITVQARDQHLVSMLEETVHSWETTISSAVERVLKRVPQGNGPLAEVDFWRERNAALSAIFEQLNLPAIERTLKILDSVHSESLASFNYHQ